MNNDGKHAVHTVIRDMREIDSFEEEIAELRTAGYTVEGFTVGGARIYALMVKILADRNSGDEKKI
jgi:hypothetical protein